MGLDAMILVFWMLSFKPDFSLSSFTFIKRLFSSSLLSAIRVVSSVYLRLLIFLLATLIPVCASCSLACHMMYSAFKLLWLFRFFAGSIQILKSFFYFCENYHWNFDIECIELTFNFLGILPILIPSTHEPRIPFHLFVFFNFFPHGHNFQCNLLD